MENFESHYFAGAGKLLLGDLDANSNPHNLEFIGDITEANLTPEIDRGSVIENVTGSSAKAVEWVRSTNYNFSGRLRSVKHNHLALALQAGNTAKTASSVTDEAHTAKQDKFISLLHTNVSNVVITGSGGTPTYVADTDYKLYADEGMVEILSTGSIADDAAILVDYDYAAQHHLTANPAPLTKCLVFAGKNLANNQKQTRCTIYAIKLDPSVLGFISQEAQEMPIAGSVEIVSARPAGDQLYSWKLED